MGKNGKVKKALQLHKVLQEQQKKQTLIIKANDLTVKKIPIHTAKERESRVSEKSTTSRTE